MFNSLDDIKKEFELSDTDPDNMLSNLKEKAKLVHPDTNGATDENKSRTLRVTEAINFLNIYKKANSNLEIIKKEETVQLSAQRERLDITQKVKDYVSTQRISIIKEMKESFIIPKLSSISLTSIVTLIWIFPGAIVNHPLLGTIITKVFNEHYAKFTVAWLLLLFLTLIVWIFDYKKRKDELVVYDYLTDTSVHDRLFEGYIGYISSLKEKPYVSTKNALGLKFTKRNLINFLIEYGVRLYSFLMYVDSKSELYSPNFIGMVSKVSELGIITNRKLKRRRINKHTAVVIAESIIDLATMKKFITVESNKRVEDVYVIIEAIEINEIIWTMFIGALNEK